MICQPDIFSLVSVNVQHLFYENCKIGWNILFCQIQTSMLPHVIQICKSECKCAGCSVLQLCPCLSVQIENIDACLSFLAAKGVNIQGLSAEGKLDSCTSAFTGTREVDPNLGQARPTYETNVLCAVEKMIKNGSLIH